MKNKVQILLLLTYWKQWLLAQQPAIEPTIAPGTAIGGWSGAGHGIGVITSSPITVYFTSRVF